MLQVSKLVEELTEELLAEYEDDLDSTSLLGKMSIIPHHLQSRGTFSSSMFCSGLVR